MIKCVQFGEWFPPCTPVSSSNKTDHHDITEILLKVELDIIYLNQTNYIQIVNRMSQC